MDRPRTGPGAGQTAGSDILAEREAAEGFVEHPSAPEELQSLLICVRR